jgi:tRNA(Ile)-lysidine synthase
VTRLDPTQSILRAVEAVLRRRPRLLLAVSGGVDSMVLLDAAARVGNAELRVATFDHATGPEATRAADHVKRACAARGLAYVAARAAVRCDSEASLRTARWSFLRAAAAEFGAPVATAHTADDQVETVCLRVLRDAGARGLAGLYAYSPVVRPLLGVWRERILEYAEREGVDWVDDPTNASRRYARNRVRHDLLPALRRARPSIELELLDIARRAAEWRDELDECVDHAAMTEAAAGERALDVRADAITRCDESGRSVLWPAIAARAGVILDRRGIARLVAFTATARVGSRIQLSGGWEVVRSRDAFQLRASTSPDVPARSIAATGGRWGDWHFRPAVAPERDDAWCATLPVDGSFTVRTWRPGDRMVARHGESPRLVKHFLSNAGVTGHERSRWPVVLVGEQIVWIPGVRRSEAATARSGRPGLPLVCEYHTS